MAWIETPNGVTVNENAVAEILNPRELGGGEYIVEIVMLDSDPSRQNKRPLCKGSQEECDTFLADLKADLDIIPRPKKTTTSRSKSKASKATAETETT